MRLAIFVRHGQAESNLGVYISGSTTKYPLTKLGRQQAEKAGKALEAANGQIDKFYASPVLRTQQTAEIISRHIGMKPAVNKTVGERIFGDFEGLKFYTEEDADLFVSEEAEDKYANGMESWPQIKRRAKRFSESLEDGKVYLVVTHLDIIRATIGFMRNIKDELEVRRDVKVGHGTFTTIDFDLDTIYQTGEGSISEEVLDLLSTR